MNNVFSFLKSMLKLMKKYLADILFLVFLFIILMAMAIYITTNRENDSIIIPILILFAGILGTLIYKNIVFYMNIPDRHFNEMKSKIRQNNEDKTDIILSKYSFLHDLGHLVIQDSMKSSEIETINKKLVENNKQYNDLRQELKEVIIKQKGQKDILELMFDNMSEIRAYFSISKHHAKLSFWLAILNCLVGIGLLCLSVYFALTGPNIEPAIIAAVAGAVSELFAATSLVVHKKSLTQLNHYYNALHENEMFLSTVNLVGNLSIDKQDEMFIEIIKNELNVRLSRISVKNDAN